MLFVFRPKHTVGLASGTLKQVVSSTGVALSMVRDAASGEIVGRAVGVVSEPFIAIPQLIFGSLELVQTDTGVQQTYRILDAIQEIVGVLQATTAAIGVGVADSVSLSAVNMSQALNLRKQVEQERVEVKDGFIDLKEALKDVEAEIMNRLDRVAEDVEFKNHRRILAQAYGRFQEGMKLIKIAMSVEDISTRNVTLGNAQVMLAEPLAEYNSPQMLSETCAAGQLRRMECAWAIEQAIALTYQLQKEPVAVSDSLSHLQDKIRRDALTVIDRCESEDELNFLFPEIARIQKQDLAVLEAWQNHVDWVRNLSASELEEVQNADFSNSEAIDTANSGEATTAHAKSPEEELYENLRQKSHFLALRDQLKFMIKPELRRGYETYISQRTAASGYKSLVPSNLQQMSDLGLTNLYWYFKVRDEQEPEAAIA